MLLTDQPEYFDASRRLLAVRSVKDVFTMHLGQFFVHYYYARSAPTEMKSVICAKVNGRYQLSDDMSATIRMLLESKRTLDAIEKMWPDRPR